MPTPDSPASPARLSTHQRLALAKLALIDPPPPPGPNKSGASRASASGGSATQKFQDFVRHKPLLALGGAAAAGFALMLFNKSPLLKSVATLAGTRVAMAALRRALG